MTSEYEQNTSSKLGLGLFPLKEGLLTPAPTPRR